MLSKAKKLLSKSEKSKIETREKAIKKLKIDLESTKEGTKKRQNILDSINKKEEEIKNIQGPLLEKKVSELDIDKILKQSQKEVIKEEKEREKQQKKEEKEIMKEENEKKKQQEQEKKEIRKALAQVKKTEGEKLKRGEARSAESQKILSLRGEIMALGKKKKKYDLSEEEEKQVNKLMAEKKTKIEKLKEEEKEKTETKTDEPKTAEALREIAQEDQKALIEQAKTEEKKKEPKTYKLSEFLKKAEEKPKKNIKKMIMGESLKVPKPKDPKDPIHPPVYITEERESKYDKPSEREQKYKTPPKKGMSKEGSDAIYKMITEERPTEPPLPPLPSEAKIKRMLENKKRKEEEEDERKAEKRDIDIEETRAREKIKKEKIKEKERKEPKSSLDIFEEEIGGITRAEMREYGKRRERTRKTAERIRKQEERREQPRTKRQMEHIYLNQRIEDMSEYGLSDPLQEFIYLSQHERKEREPKNKDHIDNRKMTIKADTTNKTMSQIEQEEEQKEFNKQLEAQLWADKFLSPNEYDEKHNLYGQESYNNIERKLMSNIEIYERQVVGEVIKLTKKREEAIRRGEIDPDREYTIGDYNEMFNYTDEAKQQRRERHLDVIEDFMRENNISSSALQGRRLSELGDRGLRHIAESIGVGEDSYNRYEGLLDVYEVAREMGITKNILERPEIKETYMGRALRTLDQEGFEKGGKLTNISKKFGSILEAMTVPVKMMAGTSDLGDVRRLWEGFKGGRDIAQGVGRVIKAQPKEEKQTTTRDYEPYDDTRILEELKNIRGELGQQTGSGLKYPEQKEITPYYFPRPDQYYNSVGLIKNSITNYLNDMNIYGGSYTSDNNLNDI